MFLKIKRKTGVFLVAACLAATGAFVAVSASGDGAMRVCAEESAPAQEISALANAADGNALLSQHANYGGEWSVADWTYGSYQTQYAPRLAHGDPGAYQSVTDFAADNDLVTFELYVSRGSGQNNREKIGETFNRHAFADYINASVPAGNYVLEAHVAAYTTAEHTHWFDGTAHEGQASGVAYDKYDEQFTFTVAKAEFTGTNVDTLRNERYEYNYDGQMHLFDSTFTLNAPVNENRTGIWAEAKYDSYYTKAELLYNLSRWNNGTYETEEELAAQPNERQKPQGVDTYTVRYKLVAPNYEDYGGESFFVVAINKGAYDMSDVEFNGLYTTYDGTVKTVKVSGLPEGVTYEVDGRTNAGNHRLVVTFKGDEVNYEPIPSRTVTLVISKAAVIIPDERTATLEGDSYDFTAGSNLYEVVGEHTFTKAGEYTVTLKLKDAANYVWQTADGIAKDSATVETFLTLKAADKPVTPPVVKPESGGNKVDGWLIGNILLGVLIAGEVAFVVLKLLRKNKNKEGKE